MRKYSKLLISSLLIASLAVTPVMAAEGPAVDMNSLTFSEEDAAEINAWRSEVDAAQGEVNELTAQLSTLIEEIGILEGKLIAKGEEITQAQKDLDAAQEKCKRQYEAMKLRIRFMYESGNGSLAQSMVSGSESMSDVMNKAEYAFEISTYDRDMLTSYEDTQKEILALKDQLVTEQDELLVMQDEMNAREDELNDLIDEKKQEVADFDAMLQEAINTATRHAVEAEQARIRAAADAAALSAAQAGYSMEDVEQAYIDAGGSIDEYYQNEGKYRSEYQAVQAAAAARAAAQAQAEAQAEAAARAAAAAEEASYDEASYDEADYDDGDYDDGDYDDGDYDDDDYDEGSADEGTSDDGDTGYEAEDTGYEEEDSSDSGSSYGGYDAGTGNAIVDAAYTQLGVPYVWGGSTPYSALDCSGLVQYCYSQAGKSIPRTSAEMIATGTPVSDPQPGDICWTPGHVAIYIGDGQMIEAQQPGVPVKVSDQRVSQYLRY